MVNVKARALLLLLLLLSTVVLQFVEAASSKKGDRQDALDAGKEKKAAKGAGGKMKDGTNKSTKLAESLNVLQQHVGELRGRLRCTVKLSLSRAIQAPCPC